MASSSGGTPNFSRPLPSPRFPAPETPARSSHTQSTVDGDADTTSTVKMPLRKPKNASPGKGLLLGFTGNSPQNKQQTSDDNVETTPKGSLSSRLSKTLLTPNTNNSVLSEARYAAI
jgi:hypothetical protein